MNEPEPEIDNIWGAPSTPRVDLKFVDLLLRAATTGAHLAQAEVQQMKAHRTPTLTAALKLFTRANALLYKEVARRRDKAKKRKGQNEDGWTEDEEDLPVEPDSADEDGFPE